MFTVVCLGSQHAGLRVASADIWFDVEDTDSPAYKSREEDFIPADDERVRRFVHALRCMTVSMEEHVQNHSELSRLRQLIVSSEESS